MNARLIEELVEYGEVTVKDDPLGQATAAFWVLAIPVIEFLRGLAFAPASLSSVFIVFSASRPLLKPSAAVLIKVVIAFLSTCLIFVSKVQKIQK